MQHAVINLKFAVGGAYVLTGVGDVAIIGYVIIDIGVDVLTGMNVNGLAAVMALDFALPAPWGESIPFLRAAFIY